MHIIFILALVIAPASAHAYLDPGSGAVLINLLIAGIAAAAYSLKSLFFRLIGKKVERKSSVTQAHIALLSEGRAYQHTFLPLLKSFIARKIHVAYYSLDIEDPLLKLDSPYVDNRFLGFAALGRYRANKLGEPIVLCTTPNIGCPGYPIKRSPKTLKLIHVFHSLVDLSMYRKGSLDHYDMVILPGDYHIAPIREIEAKRKLPRKELIALGSPYLDVLLAEKNTIELSTEPNCILVASSWGDKGLLKQYGIRPFIKLAERDYRVIIRPHPHSLKHEPQLLKRLQQESSGISSIEWDFELSPVATMSRASLMISDTSSVRFDFAFIYEKPVISLEISEEAMPGFERDDLREIWMDEAAEEIGQTLPKQDVTKYLESVVESMLKQFYAPRIRAYRDANVQNFGNAAEAIVNFLSDYK
ncbi:MAG: CDP-glycerol glycerophosphotransferase family protein [Candidatus Cloacimonetes bacterium]|jgi:hypothetical protein|nr:CDP-glycerol glycerophosphotransferase family protein [Candidatus Cloacimonadota bacterium]